MTAKENLGEQSIGMRLFSVLLHAYTVWCVGRERKCYSKLDLL